MNEAKEYLIKQIIIACTKGLLKPQEVIKVVADIQATESKRLSDEINDFLSKNEKRRYSDKKCKIIDLYTKKARNM